MQDTSTLLLNLLLVGVFLAGIGILWVLPVVLGVRWARRKGYSTLWMLFGLHPIGAWIVAAVMQLLPPRVRCSSCHQPFDQRFVRCPFCETPAHVSADALPPPAVEAVVETPTPRPHKPSARSAPRSNVGMLVVLSLSAGALLLGCSGLVAFVFFVRVVREDVEPALPSATSALTEASEPPPGIREFPANGTAVAADTPLDVGQSLHGEWAGTWYVVEVREVLPDGNVKVYWTDWRHDEILPRSRLQLPSASETP